MHYSFLRVSHTNFQYLTPLVDTVSCVCVADLSRPAAFPGGCCIRDHRHTSLATWSRIRFAVVYTLVQSARGSVRVFCVQLLKGRCNWLKQLWAMAGKSFYRRARDAVKKSSGSRPQRWVLSLRPSCIGALLTYCCHARDAGYVRRRQFMRATREQFT